MIREIISRAEENVTLQLPKEMVGKTVEVIAFEIEESKPELTKEERLLRIREITKSSMKDLSNFKFNRDEANNYDE
jgi:hypothetical protein